MAKKNAKVNTSRCVACGACIKDCPRGAIEIIKGCYASVNTKQCVGCGICQQICPAGSIDLVEQETSNE